MIKNKNILLIKTLGNVFNEKRKLKNVLTNGCFLRVFMTGEVFTLFEVEKNRTGITAQFKNPILLTTHSCAHTKQQREVCRNANSGHLWVVENGYVLLFTGSRIYCRCYTFIWGESLRIEELQHI